MAKREDYPGIADYALIGDCHSAALISRTAAIEWCCLPRFDSGSAFAAHPRPRAGGTCSITPVKDGDWMYSRRYLERLAGARDDAAWTGRRGEDRSTCFSSATSARASTGASCGPSRLDAERSSSTFAWPRALTTGRCGRGSDACGLQLHSAVGGNDALVIWCERELTEDPDHELGARLTVGAGERVRLLLSYCRPELIDGGATSAADPAALDADVETTLQWWRAWASNVSLDSPDEPSARRSAIVLKALTYVPTGAVVAAPTTLAARGDRRRAQLGLPLRLGARLELQLAGVRRGRLRRRRPTRSGAS